MKRLCESILALALLGAASATAAPPGNSGAVPYMPAAAAAARSGYVRNSGGAFFVAGKSSLQLIPNKPVCIVNGVKVHQCFPTRRSSGKLHVSRLDAQKTITPLSPRRTGVFRHRVVTITIDPGHGGRDRGAAGTLMIEKMATLMLAKRLSEILRGCGYKVNFTRTRDYFVPLGERCRIQRQHKSDLFISIHVNAAANRGFHGIETFALTPAGAASTSGGPPSNRSFSGNRFDANNLFLAHSIQKALLRRTGAFDRGVKRARFAVLRDINAPGVLIEVGFVSNPREERKLINSRYREQVVRAIAEGIISYHRAMLGK